MNDEPQLKRRRVKEIVLNPPITIEAGQECTLVVKGDEIQEIHIGGKKFVATKVSSTVFQEEAV